MAVLIIEYVQGYIQSEVGRANRLSFRILPGYSDELVQKLNAVFAEQEAMGGEPLARGETSRETEENFQYELRNWYNYRPATGHFPKDQGKAAG